MDSASAASVASTPFGRVTGYFAMRDMAASAKGCPCDDAQHFAAHAGGAPLGIGHAHALTLLPTRLDQSRDLATQRDFAQLVACEAELAEHSARPAGQPAPVAKAHGRGVPRKLLQLLARLLAVLVGELGVVDG